MKKKIIAMLIVTCICLTGCGNDVKVIEKDKSDVQAEQESNSDEENVTETKDNEVDDYDGYQFVTENQVIRINEEAQTIIDALGEPSSYFEAASCAFEGLDKMYTYNHYEVVTYPKDDKDYIMSVLLMDDLVATEEGVQIGDSWKKVVETYGENWTEEKGMKVYNKGDMALRFVVEGETVISIEYMSTILE